MVNEHPGIGQYFESFFAGKEGVHYIYFNDMSDPSKWMASCWLQKLSARPGETRPLVELNAHHSHLSLYTYDTEQSEDFERMAWKGTRINPNAIPDAVAWAATSKYEIWELCRTDKSTSRDWGKELTDLFGRN